MTPKWMTALICAWLCIPSAANATDPIPDKTGAFVPYCMKHFDECKQYVVGIGADSFTDRLFGRKSATTCVIPEGTSAEDGFRKILSWLAGQVWSPVYVEMKVEDGIHAAEKALWNCKAKLGDGPPPSATPEKVGPFVSYCTTNYIMCANKILALAGGAVDNAEPKHCLPPQGTDPKTITLSTIAWLKQRPETYGLDTDDTIGVAFAHIWPCH